MRLCSARVAVFADLSVLLSSRFCLRCCRQDAGCAAATAAASGVLNDLHCVARQPLLLLQLPKPQACGPLITSCTRERSGPAPRPTHERSSCQSWAWRSQEQPEGEPRPLLRPAQPRPLDRSPALRKWLDKRAHAQCQSAACANFLEQKQRAGRWPQLEWFVAACMLRTECSSACDDRVCSTLSAGLFASLLLCASVFLTAVHSVCVSVQYCSCARAQIALQWKRCPAQL